MIIPVLSEIQNSLFCKISLIIIIWVEFGTLFEIYHSETNQYPEP